MTDTRKAIADQLRKEGKSYAEIGEILKITRQRVHQLLTGYKAPNSGRRKTSPTAEA